MFVYRMGCSFRGWGVCIYRGWSVSLRDGVLVYGLGGYKRDGVLIYRMSC